MKFLGLLFLDVLVLLAMFVSSTGLKDKSLGFKIGTFLVGLVMMYVWSIGVYYSILMIIRG